MWRHNNNLSRPDATVTVLREISRQSFTDQTQNQAEEIDHKFPSDFTMDSIDIEDIGKLTAIEASHLPINLELLENSNDDDIDWNPEITSTQNKTELIYSQQSIHSAHEQSIIIVEQSTIHSEPSTVPKNASHTSIKSEKKRTDRDMTSENLLKLSQDEIEISNHVIEVLNKKKIAKEELTQKKKAEEKEKKAEEKVKKAEEKAKKAEEKAKKAEEEEEKDDESNNNQQRYNLRKRK